MTKLIRLTAHAKAKRIFLREHGFQVDEQDIIETVRKPDRVSRGRMGRWVAERRLTARHLLRVIYEESPQERVVITCYPARRSRYESTHDV